MSDIEILKERYKRVIDCINSRDLPLFVEDTVEDIFNRLEQDERVIEEMAECIHRTQHCKVLFGGKVVPYYTNEIIDHFRKRCE